MSVRRPIVSVSGAGVQLKSGPGRAGRVMAGPDIRDAMRNLGRTIGSDRPPAFVRCLMVSGKYRDLRRLPRCGMSRLKEPRAVKIVVSKQEKRPDTLRKELAELRESALSELERRGYNVRGKTPAQIRKVLRRRRPKPRC